MIDYLLMRKSMIAGQLLPGRINDESILNAFLNVPRENFLPKNLKPIAYSDTVIDIGSDKFMIDPLNLAKMIQYTQIKSDNLVLIIGSNYGYETALVSKIASTVIGLEANCEFKNSSERKIKELNINNALIVEGELNKGYNKYAPYDVILVLGSISFLKENLFNQLSSKGRLIASEPHSNFSLEGKAVMYSKTDNSISKQNLFDLTLPKIQGFESDVKNNFVF